MGRKSRSKGGADLGRISQVFEEAMRRQDYQELPEDKSKSVELTKPDLVALMRRYINWPPKGSSCEVGVSSEGTVLRLNDKDRVVLWIKE